MRSPWSAVVLGLFGAVCAIMSAHAGCGGDIATTSGTGATTSAASTSASSGAGGASASSSSSAIASSGAGGASASSASTSSSSATTSSGAGGASVSTTSSSATTSSGAGGAIGAGGAVPFLDAGPTCAPSAFLEAGTGWEGDAEVPIYHRAAPSCCPTQRGPAPGPQPYPPDEAVGCTMDSDCTQGANGRCFPFGGLVYQGGCWYDECYTDSACPSGGPCICRTSASDSSANTCAFGGNCVLDSDCGPGGFCSPSVACDQWPVPGWVGYGYYCHTAADTCINDTDCPFIDAGLESCGIPSVCQYDTQAKHWACNTQQCCLP